MAPDLAEIKSPLVRLSRYSQAPLWAKAEHLLPSGSVFDRVADRVVAGARGPKVTVIGAGSPCLAFAEACARAGLSMKAIIPSWTLKEHQMLLHSFEQVTVVTDDQPDPKAEQDVIFYPDMLDPIAGLFEQSVGRELAEDLPGLAPGADLVVVPSANAGLAEGIRRAVEAPSLRVREVSALEGSQIDGLATEAGELRVTEDEIFETRATLARTEGLLVGLSSAACIFAADRALKEGTSKSAVALVIDAGDRYFSRDEARRKTDYRSERN